MSIKDLMWKAFLYTWFLALINPFFSKKKKKKTSNECNQCSAVPWAPTITVSVDEGKWEGMKELENEQEKFPSSQRFCGYLNL